MPIVALPDRTQEYLRQNRFSILMEENGLWYETYLLTCDIPAARMEYVEFWDGTVGNKLMTKIDLTSDIDMSFYMPETESPLFKWINDHGSHVEGGITVPANVHITTRYKRNLLVMLLDGNLSPLKEWDCRGCQLTRVQFDKASYQSEGEVVVANISVMADRVLFPEG